MAQHRCYAMFELHDVLNPVSPRQPDRLAQEPYGLILSLIERQGRRQVPSCLYSFFVRRPKSVFLEIVDITLQFERLDESEEIFVATSKTI